MSESEAHEQHAQIMTALEALSKKLIQSEQERAELKEFVRDKAHESEDLRTLLEKSEISRIRQQESMLGMLDQAISEQENLKQELKQRAVPDLSEFKTSQDQLKSLIAKNQKEMRSIRLKQRDQDTLGVKAEFVEEQIKKLHSAVQDANSKATETKKVKRDLEIVSELQKEIRKTLEENDVRQARLAEEVKQTKQKQTQMSRRLDSSVQRYQRLERKFRRVEQIALESQEALQAKALVLLTDQSRLQIEGPRVTTDLKAEPKQKTKTVEQDNAFTFLKENLRTAAAIALVLGITAGLGFAITKVNFENHFSFEQASSDSDEGDFEEASEIETASGRAITSDNFYDPDEYFEDKTAAAFSFDTNIIPDETLTGAAKKLEKEALAGNPKAQHDLAALYAGGVESSKPNYKRAATWFHEAAKNGVGNAAYNLGVLFHQGLGVPQSVENAVEWYQQAAKADHAEAHYNLGIAYVEGIGLEFDAESAATHFELAARKNIPEAAYNLGLILENGLLGDPNINQALYWYETAAKGGNEQAQQAFDQLSTIAAEQAAQPSNEENISDTVEEAVEEEQHSSNTTSTSQAKDTAVSAYAAPLEKSVKKTVPPSLPDVAYSEDDSSVWIPSNNISNVSPEELVLQEIQTHLQNIDLYTGEKTGTWDNKTKDAIMAYQALYELPVTGAANEVLLEHMRGNIASTR